MKKRTKNYLMFMAIFIWSAISTQATAQKEENSEWKAPKEAEQLSNPFKGNAEATKAGKKIYKQQCAICHGDSGKGDGVAGVALKPRPSSFKSERVQKETDGVLFWKITNGNAPMAAYKNILTEEQRWQVVNYIRTLSK